MRQATAKQVFIVLSALLIITPAAINPGSYDITGVKPLFFFACAAVLAVILSGEKEIKLKPAVLLPLAYIAWAVLSAVLSPHRVFSIMPVLTLVSLYIVFFASSLLPREFIYALRSAVIVSCVLPVTAGLLEFLFPGIFAPMMQFGSRIPSLFGNPNFFGAWLVIVFPLAMWRGLYGLGMRKWVNLTLAVACAAMILLTGSKAATIGLIAEIVIFGIYFISQRGRTAAALIISVIFAAVCLAMALQVIKRSAVTGESFFFRQQVWKGTAAMIKEMPITGFGKVAFATVFPVYRPHSLMKWAAEDEYEITYPENFILQSGAETGIPGMLIAAALFIFAVYLGLKEEKEALDFGAGMAGIITVNLMGVDMNYVSTSAVLAVYAGVLAGGSHEKEGISLKKVWIVGLMAFAAAAAGFYASVKKEISSNHLASGVINARAAAYDKAIEDFSKALRLNSLNLDAAYFMGKAYYDSGKKDSALRAYGDIQWISPFFVSLQLKLADLYMEMGMPQDSERHYKRMLGVNPYSEPAAYGIARAAFILERPLEAVPYVERALEKHAKSHTLYNALGNLKMKSGDYAGAYESYKKAVDLSPAEDYHYNLRQAEKMIRKAEK